MRAARKTAEEQYQLILECRRSGMSDADWCREKGINPETFYTWIRRLRQKACFPIPAASGTPSRKAPANEIVRMDVLPDEALCGPDGTPAAPLPASCPPSIEIRTDKAMFRFTGPVDPSLYEKTLLAIGGRL